MKKSGIILMLFGVFLNSEGKDITLILSGVDTIQTVKEYGFDFISRTACTTATFHSGYDCNNHFWFFYLTSMEKYDLSSYAGYGYQAGKVNLDSLKTAPPDSIFNKMPLHIDSTPPDSLSSRVGNCYWIKTGPDPRRSWLLYAKIKILSFKVLDSAARKVEMRFLWAANVSGYRDIITSGLDTFHLDVTPVISRRASSPATRSPAGQRVFKVVGDRFVVPKELVGTNAQFSVYDLSGKRLGRIQIKGKQSIYIGEIRGNKIGLLVVKVGL